ncbi:MAG: transposase [Methylophilaceae bacterium]
MERKRFNTADKIAILKEASENGVIITLDKHAIYPATYYSWKRKLESMGEVGFVHGMTPGHLKRIRELEKENKMLKEIIVEKDLAGKLKDDLLKKKFALEKKKHS